MFLMDHGDVDKLLKLLTNYTIYELEFMAMEYEKSIGRKPTTLLIPRLTVLGLKCDFYDELKPALYSKMKVEELDA